MRRLPWIWIAVATLAGPLWAGPPSIRELRPWGAQRGQSVSFTVAGDLLASGAEVFSAIPGKLEEQPGASATQLTYKLQLRPDAAAGVYPIRLRTATGLSNVLLFSVGELPELAESEPNDPPAPGTPGPAATDAPLALPITINGSVTGSDQDAFRFSGKKGDRIVLEVEAQRIGSPLDPAIRLYSATGRELAFADETRGLGLDCRIDFAVPDDGDYVAVLHDSRYAGAGPAHYRLKIGAFHYAETVFPLGWQRGQEVELTLGGGTYSEPARVKVMADAASDRTRTLVTAGLPGFTARLPFRFALGDLPERIEPASESIDERCFQDAAVINGRISRPNEVDRYKVPVAAGATWVVEVDAANLGSPIDALVTVAGPQGNVLASADDGNGLDPRLQFNAPNPADHVVVSIEDLHKRGGAEFAYRLKVRPARADYSLQVQPAGPPPGAPAPPATGPTAINIPRGGTAIVQVSVTRGGYNGPIQLTIPEDTAGITAEDGLIPAGAATGLLVLAATPDAALRAFDLQIAGHGGSPTKPMVRHAAASGRADYAASDAFHARVPAAVCEPHAVQFQVAERSIKLIHGHTRPLKITAQRGSSATELINISGTGLPGGSVLGTSGPIAKEANELTLNLNCSPENPVVGVFTMQLQASTQAGGRAETIDLPPVKVEIARPFSLELLTPSVTMTAGSKARIAVVIRREAPFDGVVKLAPAGSLPQHVSMPEVEVAKGESLGLIEFAAAPEAGTAELDLAIRASTDMEGRKRDKDYVIPDTVVKIKIVPATAP